MTPPRRSIAFFDTHVRGAQSAHPRRGNRPLPRASTVTQLIERAGDKVGSAASAAFSAPMPANSQLPKSSKVGIDLNAVIEHHRSSQKKCVRHVSDFSEDSAFLKQSRPIALRDTGVSPACATVWDV